MWDICALQTYTITEEARLYPSKIAFRVASGDTLWWDLVSLFMWCRALGDKYPFKAWRRKALRLVGARDDSPDEIKFRGTDTTCASIAPACSTNCLVLLLWRLIEYSQRTYSLRDGCAQCLMSIITQIALSLPREMARMNFMVSPNHLVALEVRPDGSVDNFYTLVLQRAPRRSWLSVLKKSWLHARLNERPLGAFHADTHSLVDIVFCLSMCSSLRSQHKMHSLSRDFYE